MRAEIEQIIAQWEKNPRDAAKRLVDYYGEPDEVTPSRLIWHNTFDGWKRTVLVNEETPHNFPAPHTDYLEQSIDYQVPLDKYNDLAAFDGSVVADRTQGELSARCGGTSMNFVAVNLAHDIVTGQRTVAEARQEYTRLYQAFKGGEKPPYTQEFQFELPKGSAQDPDKATV